MVMVLLITKIIQNKPDVRDDLPPSECVPASSESQSSHAETTNRALPPTQFQKSCTCSTVNVGYPRLMAQHPAHAQPARAFLYRSTVLLTNMGYPGFARP